MDDPLLLPSPTHGALPALPGEEIELKTVSEMHRSTPLTVDERDPVQAGNLLQNLLERLLLGL